MKVSYTKKCSGARDHEFPGMLYGRICKKYKYSVLVINILFF